MKKLIMFLILALAVTQENLNSAWLGRIFASKRWQKGIGVSLVSAAATGVYALSSNPETDVEKGIKCMQRRLLDAYELEMKKDENGAKSVNFCKKPTVVLRGNNVCTDQETIKMVQEIKKDMGIKEDIKLFLFSSILVPDEKNSSTAGVYNAKFDIDGHLQPAIFLNDPVIELINNKTLNSPLRDLAKFIIRHELEHHRQAFEDQYPDSFHGNSKFMKELQADLEGLKVCKLDDTPCWSIISMMRCREANGMTHPGGYLTGKGIESVREHIRRDHSSSK